MKRTALERVRLVAAADGYAKACDGLAAAVAVKPPKGKRSPCPFDEMEAVSAAEEELRAAAKNLAAVPRLRRGGR